MPRTPPPRPNAAALLVEVLRVLGQQFSHHYNALQDSDDPEHPHRARVTLRRLRSALTGFAPILDAGAARKLSRSARRMFRALGPLREADVAVISFAADHDRATRTAHADRLRQTARAALAQLGAADWAPRLEAQLEAGTLLSRKPDARRLAQADARMLGVLALQTAWVRVRVYGDVIAALDPETRHEFRKDMKTLRYLAEFVAPLWPARDSARFLARMQRLQDDLGALNDIAVHARGAPLGADLEARARDALSRAEIHWRRLRKPGALWWTGAATGAATGPKR